MLFLMCFIFKRTKSGKESLQILLMCNVPMQDALLLVLEQQVHFIWHEARTSKPTSLQECVKCGN